ncbi:MAG TPA: bifunctional DNA-binding transcriptional regulator/O6-methylguanine-DNA methyltransferase Ada, partial [Gemmatimonadaceae bacterium]|nr:bifunctional DNA-binding transcriptional regulator/O6-methylguanine-DNA methyltransferase Ada [Gemmatimonadaceae bacterium]
MSAHIEAARWKAVVARDAEQDGRFVFAVRTTGVYCKPSCASRRALRENVRFFADPGAAEAAGFRACKRCDPRATESAASRVIAKARAYLEAHVDEPPALGALARTVGMSASHLQRTFTRHVGVSPRKYAAALRADSLKAHLRAGATVSRATFDAGYGASSRAYDAAIAQLGMTPGAYRRGGKGVQIRYMTAATSLGRLLVAATERGVCAITLGDDDAMLENALNSEYPQSTRTRVRGARGDAQLRAWVTAVCAYIEGSKREIAVPLDVAGTPFQQRVWQALQGIPYGETRSYAQVAASIAAPSAARAVASACARNRVSLVIPCHRVVRGTGALGGYRWGLARKEQLLARERRSAAGG